MEVSQEKIKAAARVAEGSGCRRSGHQRWSESAMRQSEKDNPHCHVYNIPYIPCDAPPRSCLSCRLTAAFYHAADNKGCKNILKELDYCHGRPLARAK
jgi:hypothetical protein